MNRNDRAITGLVMVAHAMVHTYELSLPLLLPVWQTEFSTVALPTGTFAVTGFVMGVVLTLGYAPFGLGALPGGVLADAYGSRRLILACLVGMGASFLLLAVSPGLVAIAFALFVWGVAASVYHPSGLALISKGVEERGSAFAYHGMAGNLGIALGPLATALLLFGLGDWRVVVGLLAAPALVAAVAAARIDVDETAAVGSDAATDGGSAAAPPAPPDGGATTEDDADDDGADAADEGTSGDARASGSVSSLSEFLADSRLLFGGAFVLVFAAVMLSGLYYRGLLTFLPEILGQFPSLAPIEFAGRSLEPERYFYVGLLMVGIVGQYAGGRLTDRIPVELGLLAGYGMLAVLAVLFLPVATMGLVPLLVMGALVGFFLFVVQPFYQATVAEYTPAGARGLSYGYTYLGVFGVGALGGAVAGGVLTYANDAALFAVLAGFGALAALCGAVLYVRR